ncbi:CWC16 protein [Nemania sp. FL0916]|nr:CWC16 protein [Nemania sp. FL0916]
MAERKVLSKYYPPDFDPSNIARCRTRKEKGPKVQTVRLDVPFSMRCTTCGDYIYKGRRFNARKETPVDEKYLGIQIYRFYIRCPQCAAEISFRTDPKSSGYTCERGAKRNTEPWRASHSGETIEERLDRLEEEQDEKEEERNAMVELEAKALDAKREMAVADALDEIRLRNARSERLSKIEPPATDTVNEEAAMLDDQDTAAAKRAFAAHAKEARGSFDASAGNIDTIFCRPPRPASQPKILRGLKKKEPQTKAHKIAPSGAMLPLVGYESDPD